MQTGRVYKHGNFWVFRYKVPVFKNGKKSWKDEYQKLAPLDQYDSIAALQKDGLVPKAPDTASLTPSRTQLLHDFVERIYFPGQTTKLKASTLRSYRQVYNCYVRPRTNGLRMCDFVLPVAQKFLEQDCLGDSALDFQLPKNQMVYVLRSLRFGSNRGCFRLQFPQSIQVTYDSPKFAARSKPGGTPH